MIWLSAGNAGTAAIADLLLEHRARVEAFLADAEASLLVLELVEH